MYEITYKTDSTIRSQLVYAINLELVSRLIELKFHIISITFVVV